MKLLRLLLNLPSGASSVADRIDGLHAIVIGTTMAVAAYVFASVAWFTVRYRRRGRAPLTTPTSASRRHELAVIGAVLVTFVAWWVIGYRQYVDLRRPPANAETIFVEAKQWMWKFAYVDGRTANDVLTVPIGRPIKLVMTSRDVIHSFYVPSFRLKTDVLPGRTTTMWFEATELGTFPIWCAEYCGVDHSTMRGEVEVVPLDDYARRRARPSLARLSSSAAPSPAHPDESSRTMEAPDADLVALGRATAEKRQCTACHTFDGQRHVGPTFSRLFGSERTFEDGRHAIADEAYLTRSMMEPSVDVVRGFRPVMPTYRGVLSNVEVGALVAFIASLRDEAEPAGVTLPELDVAPSSAASVAPAAPPAARSEP